MTQDEKAGAEWIKKAAMQGHASAARQLSKLYLEGRGVAADPLEAKAWAKVAAKLGKPLTADDMAALERETDKLPADKVEAEVQRLLTSLSTGQ